MQTYEIPNDLGVRIIALDEEAKKLAEKLLKEGLEQEKDAE